MQIHRIPRHERDFTVIANKAIRDPRLSHTARGILVYALSLPSGAPVNVRTLSDGFPQGRIAVAKAVKELRALGYWVTRTERDAQTRRIVSSVDVYEVPQAGSVSTPLTKAPVTAEPVPVRVGTGEAGAFFPGGTDDYEDGGKNPPLPPAAESGVAESAAPPDLACVRVLERIGDVDARLRLSARSVRELAPAVGMWLERGASVAEIVDAVTAGLPATVYSAARLVADRLERKRPPRKRAWRQVHECPECRDPLPWGQETGVCRGCRDGAGSAGPAPLGCGREEALRLLRERAA
ncbi:hypothetical protein V2W30_15175 [Streptomyces sp. Q6]|uniref:Uncharacterized protein n=1 Tax=Streptomyces citrinus TaxID=3118173 RepID=A0ACD5ABF9_9ACTN